MNFATASAIRIICFFFSSRRRHTRFDCDWSSDVCSSDLVDDELEQAHSLRLDGPVSASYSMGTSGGAKGRPWQNPFAERLIGSIRRDRRLERGRYVEPAKLVP